MQPPPCFIVDMRFVGCQVILLFHRTPLSCAKNSPWSYQDLNIISPCSFAPIKAGWDLRISYIISHIFANCLKSHSSLICPLIWLTFYNLKCNTVTWKSFLSLPLWAQLGYVDDAEQQWWCHRRGMPTVPENTDLLRIWKIKDALRIEQILNALPYACVMPYCGSSSVILTLELNWGHIWP